MVQGADGCGREIRLRLNEAVQCRDAPGPAAGSGRRLRRNPLGTLQDPVRHRDGSDPIPGMGMAKGSLVCAVAAWLLATSPTCARAALPEMPGADGRGARPAAVEFDRVVVTARRREESLQDVPQAVTAIEGGELESRGATDISALGAMAPNLTIYPTRAFNGSVTAYIRGVGQFDPVWGIEPGIGVYIDDVYLARPQGALLDVLDVQRVEVLRGPQGTLYGRNTLGGAIKVVTREPEAEFGGRFALTVGDHARRDAKAVLNLPLGEAFRARFAAAKYDRDGYGRNLVTGADVSARDAGVVRASASWRPAPEVDVRLAYDRYRDRSGTPGSQRLGVNDYDPDATPPDPGRYDVRADAPDRMDLDSEGASATVDWTIDPRWSLRSVSAWRRGDSVAWLDVDTLPRPIFHVYRAFGERQLSQEFRLQREGGDAHLVAGLYLLDATADGAGAVNSLTPPRAPLHFIQSGSIRTRSAAVYLDWVREIGASLQLDAGLRYTLERKHARIFNNSYADAGHSVHTQTTADIADARTWRAPTPRLALSWRASDAAMLYAQASRGFKGGSWNIHANTVLWPPSAHSIDAETVDALELGAKTTWFGGRLQVDAAVFHNDYRDIQLSVFTVIDGGDGLDGESFPDFRNAGSGTARGAELEWRARFGPYLHWTGNFGYLDARYDEFIDRGIDVASSRNLVAEFPLRAAGRLRARVDGRYQSRVYPTTDNSEVLAQGGYALWNAALAWTSPRQRWELSLRGENLGDVAYRTTGFHQPQQDIFTAYYGPPRSYSLTLAHSF